ncbi:MAG TPA: ATP-binding protein [Moraxellaceae bacterium]|nr:ATP-binding protein [Moraxellaceae bacterium]
MFLYRTARNDAVNQSVQGVAVIRLNKLFNRLKPRSAAWRTTLVISIVLIVSQYLSIAFFWINLYVPEMRQHAHYSAIQIRLLRTAALAAAKDPDALHLRSWVRETTGVEVVGNPREIPVFVDKPLVQIFTDKYEQQLSQELNEPVQVYFKFKPVPVAWIQVPSIKEGWVREPLLFFAQYNPFIIIAWVIGVPLMALLAIVILVRQLNRPLKRLQLAALRVGKGQHSTLLDTQSGSTEIRAVNRAFNQMTREIQQATRERTFMLAGISHDLRTPLTRLRLTAELMQDRDVAEGMVLDVEEMDAILDQFIAYMRDGSDEPVVVGNLNQIISEIMAQTSNHAEMHFEAADVPDMPMKRLSLKRMLDNLVSNGLRYGGAPLHLQTTLLPEQHSVQVTVRDHGPGIDEKELPSLLQPFVRGESARTSQGSGLGLAIVSRIVKMHNGRLDIRNHPEGGLVVTITLPLNRRPGKA